eukprot:7236342-Alexandrium_andersonii.AAC.1
MAWGQASRAGGGCGHSDGRTDRRTRSAMGVTHGGAGPGSTLNPAMRPAARVAAWCRTVGTQRLGPRALRIPDCKHGNQAPFSGLFRRLVGRGSSEYFRLREVGRAGRLLRVLVDIIKARRRRTQTVRVMSCFWAWL